MTKKQRVEEGYKWSCELDGFCGGIGVRMGAGRNENRDVARIRVVPSLEDEDQNLEHDVKGK